jgi:hypothetical protein
MLWVAQSSAQRSENSKLLMDAVVRMLGANEFCTRQTHLESEEVFGFQKRKAEMPLGFEFESYRLDRISFLRPQIEIRSSQALDARYNLHSIPKELSPDLRQGKLGPKPNTKIITPITMSRTAHVTWIQETACDKS